MKQVICWLALILGVLGVALCAAGLAGVWVYYPLAKQKTVEVYARLDEALVQVGDRIDVTRERVVTVNAMTADFRTTLKQWVTAEQLDRSQVGHRTALIAARLQQVLDGLDFAESFLQKVRSVQRVAHPFRKETETQQLDSLLEEIEKLKAHVSGMVNSIDQIRQQAEESGDAAQLEATIERAIGDVVRVIELIDTAEDRLRTFSDKVSEARVKAETLESRIQRDLRWGKWGAFIVLPWMAIGQLALCILAWRRLSSPREMETSPR